MSQDRPQQQSDDADIVRWFQAIGPPPQGQAPTHLRASVRAQIEQRRARSWLWGWLPPLWPSAVVPALAAGLALSLAVNIWWGIAWRDTPPVTLQAAQRPLPTYQFLTGIQGVTTPGVTVATRTVSDQLIGLGFAPQDARITLFRAGILYTDTLAALHRGAMEVAVQRVQALGNTLNTAQPPGALPHYLHTMQTLLHEQQYPGEELAKFLALFESLYETEYGRATEAPEVLLFRLGAWLENMALAAAADDRTALRQAAAVQYFRSLLPKLAAPPEVLRAFEQMQPLVTAQAMTEHDVRTLRGLIQNVQQVLGALPG
jgi:hypothetical protein